MKRKGAASTLDQLPWFFLTAGLDCFHFSGAVISSVLQYMCRSVSRSTGFGRPEVEAVSQMTEIWNCNHKFAFFACGERVHLRTEHVAK